MMSFEDLDALVYLRLRAKPEYKRRLEAHPDLTPPQRSLMQAFGEYLRISQLGRAEKEFGKRVRGQLADDCEQVDWVLWFGFFLMSDSSGRERWLEAVKSDITDDQALLLRVISYRCFAFDGAPFKGTDMLPSEA